MSSRGASPRAATGDVIVHYERADEASRLFHGPCLLEMARTQELLLRYLPPPPDVVLDIGGGPGAHATWLASLGYAAHLSDPVSHQSSAGGTSGTYPSAVAS